MKWLYAVNKNKAGGPSASCRLQFPALLYLKSFLLDSHRPQGPHITSDASVDCLQCGHTVESNCHLPHSFQHFPEDSVCTGVHTLGDNKVYAMWRPKGNFWYWSLLYTLFAIGSPCLSAAYANLVGLRPSENSLISDFYLLQTCWDYRPVCHFSSFNVRSGDLHSSPLFM